MSEPTRDLIQDLLDARETIERQLGLIAEVHEIRAWQDAYISSLEKLRAHADHSEFCRFQLGHKIEECECGYAVDLSNVARLKAERTG